MACPSISIIVPAFNEEAYIGPTLDSVKAAVEQSERCKTTDVQIIVVDNGSTDRTTEVARSKGVAVINAPRGNVAIARNAGARAAKGRFLVFVDADTHWPEPVFCRIEEAVSDPKCIGEAVDTEYRPKGFCVRMYLRLWRIVSRLTCMAQGATQFCKADTFSSLGGYDETVFMGEDVDFYWRLRKAAGTTGAGIVLVDDVKVVPSCRRFDNWPLWKTLLVTNPLTCLLFSRSRKPWDGWYGNPTR